MCTDVTSSYRLERRVIILSLDMFPRRKLESSCSYAISRCRFEKRMITYFLDMFLRRKLTSSCVAIQEEFQASFLERERSVPLGCLCGD